MMQYRFLVGQPDLNGHGTLHGGILMKWVDEACGMTAKIITNGVCATRCIENIEFRNTARLGDIVEIDVLYTDCGKTSLGFSATASNAITGDDIACFERVVFVAVDKDHNPRDHRSESCRFSTSPSTG